MNFVSNLFKKSNNKNVIQTIQDENQIAPKSATTNILDLSIPNVPDDIIPTPISTEDVENLLIKPSLAQKPYKPRQSVVNTFDPIVQKSEENSFLDDSFIQQLNSISKGEPSIPSNELSSSHSIVDNSFDTLTKAHCQSIVSTISDGDNSNSDINSPEADKTVIFVISDVSSLEKSLIKGFNCTGYYTRDSVSFEAINNSTSEKEQSSIEQISECRNLIDPVIESFANLNLQAEHQKNLSIINEESENENSKNSNSALSISATLNQSNLSTVDREKSFANFSQSPALNKNLEDEPSSTSQCKILNLTFTESKEADSTNENVINESAITSTVENLNTTYSTESLKSENIIISSSLQENLNTIHGVESFKFEENNGNVPVLASQGENLNIKYSAASPKFKDKEPDAIYQSINSSNESVSTTKHSENLNSTFNLVKSETNELVSTSGCEDLKITNEFASFKSEIIESVNINDNVPVSTNVNENQNVDICSANNTLIEKSFETIESIDSEIELLKEFVFNAVEKQEDKLVKLPAKLKEETHEELYLDTTVGDCSQNTSIDAFYEALNIVSTSTDFNTPNKQKVNLPDIIQLEKSDNQFLDVNEANSIVDNEHIVVQDSVKHSPQKPEEIVSSINTDYIYDEATEEEIRFYEKEVFELDEKQSENQELLVQDTFTLYHENLNEDLNKLFDLHTSEKFIKLKFTSYEINNLINSILGKIFTDKRPLQTLDIILTELLTKYKVEIENLKLRFGSCENKNTEETLTENEINYLFQIAIFESIVKRLVRDIEKLSDDKLIKTIFNHLIIDLIEELLPIDKSTPEAEKLSTELAILFKNFINKTLPLSCGLETVAKDIAFIEDKKVETDSTMENELKKTNVSNGELDNKNKEIFISGMADRLAEVEIECDDYKVQVASLKKEIDTFKAKNNALEEEINSLKMREKELTVLVDNYRSKTLDTNSTADEKDIRITQLESNEQMLMKEITELKKSLTQNEQKLNEFQKRERKLVDDLACQTNDEKKIKRVMEEYEKSIPSFLKEIEQLKSERDSVQNHLNTLEMAFSDVHQKYERTKQVLQSYKEKQEQYKQDIQQNKETITMQEQRYAALKAHAMAQLEKFNQELFSTKKEHETEMARLTAQLKRNEIKLESVIESLQQKTIECEKLSQVCDEYFGSVDKK